MPRLARMEKRPRSAAAGCRQRGNRWQQPHGGLWNDTGGTDHESPMGALIGRCPAQVRGVRRRGRPLLVPSGGIAQEWPVPADEQIHVRCGGFKPVDPDEERGSLGADVPGGRELDLLEGLAWHDGGECAACKQHCIAGLSGAAPDQLEPPGAAVPLVDGGVGGDQRQTEHAGGGDDHAIGRIAVEVGQATAFDGDLGSERFQFASRIGRIGGLGGMPAGRPTAGSRRHGGGAGQGRRGPVRIVR